MVQQLTDIINLCDSDDETYPVHHQRSGRDQDDAISILSSDDDDDSIVVVASRPPNDDSMVAGKRAEITQAKGAANRIGQTSNTAPNIEPAAARCSEATQHENPVAPNEEAPPQEPTFPRLNATVQREVTPTQANATIHKKSSQSPCGLVGDIAAANQETAIVSRRGAANDPVRLQFHMHDKGTRGSATIPRANNEDLPTRAAERSLTDPDVQNNQNQIKSEVKAEEVDAPCTFRSQPASSNEDTNMPYSDSRAKSGDESQRNRVVGSVHRRMKKVARKSVARAAELDDAKSDEQDAGGVEYIEYLLAMRMRRLHGGNHEDNDDSSDDESDDSSFAAIPKNAFSSPNSGDDAPGIPSTIHQRGGEVPDSEDSMLQRVIQIPLRNNNERIPQDVSDLSSVEQKAEGGIKKIDEDANDSMSTGSLEGPVEQSHRPMFARRRRITLDDDESMEPIQVAQSNDSRPVSESDDSNLADLTMDKDFQGGKDKFPNLRKKEKLDKLAGELLPMEKIEHLCSLRLSKETSLPTYKFSVHNVDDTIIYDFDVRVDKSNIPNAGRGVFLQFVGARELKPSRKNWGKNRKSCIRGLPEPLPAIYPHGLGVTVKLNGEGFPDPPEKVRIGNTRIYTESDYVPAPRRTFSSLHPKCSAIELGQYGPFRPEDRKNLDLFEVKGFLFSNIPNEWCFDVPEELEGKKQIIDITDELTGDTHDDACRHIPMYVNEVGHDPNLKQTVCALDKDERNVVYHIVIREPMKPGETVELLVRYDKYYEEIREKKGYGLKNMENKTKSDDHIGTFLERTYVERKCIKDQILDFKPDDINNMMGWLLSTHRSLSEIVNDFLNKSNPTAEEEEEELRKRLDTTPLAQQIVALRRFEWIARIFEKSLKRQKKKSRGSTTVSDVHEGISKLKWSKWNDLIVVLSRLQDIKDTNGKSLHLAFEREVVSELVYDMGDDMITSPMNEGLWCSLAMSLTKDLCVATAKEIWRRKTNKLSLMQVYVQLAKDAVREIVTGHRLDALSFFPSYKGDLIGFADDAIQKLKSMRATAEGKTLEVLSVVTQSDTIEPLENAQLLAAIPRVLGVDSNVQVNDSWYICCQVLYLVDSFARTYLKDSLYTFSLLCEQIGIGADETATMKAALAKKYEAQKSRAKKRKASLSSPGAPKKKQRPKSSPPGGSTRQLFFWSVTWNYLKEQCGWRLERGSRPGDFYAFPPGVTRKNGSNRTHFFDSVKQIRDRITQDEKWKENPVVKRALVEEKKCSVLYTQLKRSKSLPNLNSKDAIVDWIRSEVKKKT